MRATSRRRTRGVEGRVGLPPGPAPATSVPLSRDAASAGTSGTPPGTLPPPAMPLLTTPVMVPPLCVLPEAPAPLLDCTIVPLRTVLVIGRPGRVLVVILSKRLPLSRVVAPMVLGPLPDVPPVDDEPPPVVPRSRNGAAPDADCAAGACWAGVDRARGGWPTLTTRSPNWSVVVSRPSVSSVSANDCPCRTGGRPSPPTGASTFWLRTASATSVVVIPRAAIFCGSSQARML